MQQELLVLENQLEEEDTDTDAYWEEVNPAFDQPARRNNPMAVRAMRIAARLRKKEGLDAATALTMAWEEVRSRRKKKSGGNMLEINPLKNISPTVLLISALVVAVLIHKAVSGKWIWQGLASSKAITAPPQAKQLTAANIDPTRGMRFCDSTYSSIGEPIGVSNENIGTIFG